MLGNPSYPTYQVFIAMAFAAVIVLTVIIDVLVAGLTRRCLVAVLGSLAGTLVTCGAAVLLTHVLKLDGGDLPYVVPLLEAIPAGKYDVVDSMLRGFDKIEAMDDSCVAPDSLAREFIGGSTYDNH